MTTYNNNSLNWPSPISAHPSPVPPLVNTVITNGGTGNGILTSNAIAGASTQWSSAFTIHNNTDAVLEIGLDGIINTKAGSISINDWIQVVKLMRQFIIDVANDEETAKKYPYLKDAAHQWMMDELRK